MKKNWREGPQKVKHTVVNLADSVTALVSSMLCTPIVRALSTNDRVHYTQATL